MRTGPLSLTRCKSTRPVPRFRSMRDYSQDLPTNRTAKWADDEPVRREGPHGLWVHRVNAGLGTEQIRSEEHTSELQSQSNLVCRLLLEKKKKKINKLYCVHKHHTETIRTVH